MKTSLTRKTCRTGIDDGKYTTKHLFVADAFEHDLFDR